MKTAPDASTSATDETATIFLAIELSKKTWLVGVRLPDNDKVTKVQVDGGDTKALLQRIADQRERAAKHLGRPVRVVCCYEAGQDGFWLHRLLVANGIDNRVIDPASLPVNRRSRRAKTDRIDVKALVRAIMAWWHGDKEACRVVRVPSREQEDRRRRSRERQRLVTERGQHSTRIQALLMTLGIRSFQPKRPDWAARLEQLASGDGQPLGPGLKAEIARECERLHQVMAMIRAVEREAKTAHRAAAASQVDELCRLVSIGQVSATILDDEVFYREFAKPGQVASFVGLAPTPFNTGASRREQGISRAGNPRARRVLIELAWLWLRHQPQSQLSIWFRKRVGNATGRFKRIMIVALARKLIIALWRFVTTGLVPAGAKLKTN